MIRPTNPKSPQFPRWPGLIETYRQWLPVSAATPVITLNEGHTRLIRSQSICRELDERVELYFKTEGDNPTGSFKDRGMTLAISKALEEGAAGVMCASTGNTSASAAAYAARAGLPCVVLLPAGAIAMGKLTQALIHGAQVLAVDGNFDDCLELVRVITDKYPLKLVNSINPFRIQGQKTGAFEICEQLGRPPDYHCIPVGNAGNITAYWMGYREYHAAAKIQSLPKMLGFQAAGAAPIVLGKIVKDPKTLATAIKIGNPASWKQAEAARDESGGLIDAVTDEEIVAAYRLLASREGVFCEPASAASVAGLLKKFAAGYFQEALERQGKLTIVCILTGHGLKDPDNALKHSNEVIEVENDLQKVLKVIGL